VGKWKLREDAQRIENCSTHIDETQGALRYDEWPSGLTDPATETARTTEVSRSPERVEIRRHVARVGLGHAEVGHRAARMQRLRRAQPPHEIAGIVCCHAGNEAARADVRERRTNRRVGADHAGNSMTRRAAVLAQRDDAATRLAERRRLPRRLGDRAWRRPQAVGRSRPILLRRLRGITCRYATIA